MRIGVAATLVLLMTMGSRAALGQAAQEPGAEVETRSSRPCRWPAVGGGVAGLAVGWYGFAGAYALAGRSAFALGDTTAEVALVIGVQSIGLLGGAVAACAIWGEEERWFPSAGSAIVGGLVGGISGGAAAAAMVEHAGIDSDTDNPVASALIILGGTLTGAVVGGYLGHRIDVGARGRPNPGRPTTLAIYPFSPDSHTIALGASFQLD